MKLRRFQMYVDVMPSEQLTTHDPTTTISLVAVGYTHRSNIPFSIRQFKTYHGRCRKLRAVQELTQILSTSYFGNLQVICGLARVAEILRHGSKKLELG